jgi:hypothetical protein
MSRVMSKYEKSLSRWDDEIMWDNERWIIGLEFSRKKYINYYYSSRIELRTEPTPRTEPRPVPATTHPWIARASLQFPGQPYGRCSVLQPQVWNAVQNAGDKSTKCAVDTNTNQPETLNPAHIFLFI